MTQTQKYAWFNLAVVGWTLFVFVALLPFVGPKAMGAVGFLGLQGLGVLYFRKRPGRILADERDALIVHRAAIAAYSIFWVVFVAACVGASFLYGERGAVPVTVVQSSVWIAWMLVSSVSSLAVLIQYGRGGDHAG